MSFHEEINNADSMKKYPLLKKKNQRQITLKTPRRGTLNSELSRIRINKIIKLSLTFCILKFSRFWSVGEMTRLVFTKGMALKQIRYSLILMKI